MRRNGHTGLSGMRWETGFCGVGKVGKVGKVQTKHTGEDALCLLLQCLECIKREGENMRVEITITIESELDFINQQHSPVFPAFS